MDDIKKFRHIYVEKDIVDNYIVKDIVKKYNNSQIIIINHYKDVFNRSKQDLIKQHNAQNMIIAKKKGTLCYKGAPVCQDFGNHYFYYTSCVMNCVYDCEYCYLKGMYPSGNMVVFINLEDTFLEVENLLKQHPVYLCVSYDTDLMAIEKNFGFISKWCEFVKKHENLTIEVRTKCATKSLFENLDICDRVIFAFTMSPNKVIEQYEHFTSSLQKRIECVKYLCEKNAQVRLCFDPMIYINDYKTEYKKMLDEINKNIDIDKQILNVSVGSFRISKDFLKKMRKQEKNSRIVQFPYENVEGYYQYPIELQNEMEQFLISELQNKIKQERIFTWKE